MRTKTLLMTAALTAAGVATSMAQVYSVNAVGYVNKTIPANGLALISNPLIAQNSTIGSLFSRAGLPDGLQVFKYTASGFITATYDDIDEAFVPASAANTTLVPGEGVFVRNPSGQPITFTFVGEVPTGTLNNPLPSGLSIRSSIVPRAGTAAELGLPAVDGDQVFQFNPQTQSYRTSTYDDIDEAWAPALQPLAVGEAFFLRKAAAGTWTQTFSVNN
jgi:hypothetical protein